MTPLRILLALCLSFCTAGPQSISFGNSRPVECRDYNNAGGTCVRLAACPALKRLLNNRTSENIGKVRRSICTRNPLRLCCASEAEPPTTTTTTTTTTTKPAVIDVNNHPNRQLFPSVPQCGFSYNFDVKIVGGKETKVGEFPWIALLGYEVSGLPSDELDWNCGGTLINDLYVLTAAHCVTGLPNTHRLTAVRLGEHNLDTDDDCLTCETPVGPVQDINIDQVISHEAYNKPKRFRNDIALLRLAHTFDATLSSAIGTICLPFDATPNETLEGERLYVAGFGLTEPFGDSSVKLLKVRVPVISNAKCADIFRSQGADIGPQQMCAGGDKGKDSCSGDSGGPLMHAAFGPPYRLYGVVSFGVVRCGSQNVPGVYTRVTDYFGWILDNVRP